MKPDDGLSGSTSQRGNDSIYICIDGVLLLIFFRHDDLKEMLDSNKDSLKLEAMKRIVAVSTVLLFAGTF